MKYLWCFFERLTMKLVFSKVLFARAPLREKIHRSHQKSSLSCFEFKEVGEMVVGLALGSNELSNAIVWLC